MELTREQALALLRQYNEEPFHLRHALTVEAVMNRSGLSRPIKPLNCVFANKGKTSRE